MPKKFKLINITKDQLAQILQECARKDICEHFQISERTLDRLIKDHDLTKINYGPKKLCKQTISDIKNLHQLGQLTQKEIASKFNISQSMVSKIVNNQVHKNAKSIKISGSASVKIGYKYGN